MYGIGKTFQTGNVLIRADLQEVFRSGGSVDRTCFNADQSAVACCDGGIVFNHAIAYKTVVKAETDRHTWQHNAVAESHVSNGDRLK